MNTRVHRDTPRAHDGSPQLNGPSCWSQQKLICARVKCRCIKGMVIPPFIGNLYICIPYYWIDDHHLTRGNKGSLGTGTCKKWLAVTSLSPSKKRQKHIHPLKKSRRCCQGLFFFPPLKLNVEPKKSIKGLFSSEPFEKIQGLRNFFPKLFNKSDS